MNNDGIVFRLIFLLLCNNSSRIIYIVLTFFFRQRKERHFMKVFMFAPSVRFCLCSSLINLEAYCVPKLTRKFHSYRNGKIRLKRSQNVKDVGLLVKRQLKKLYTRKLWKVTRKLQQNIFFFMKNRVTFIFDPIALLRINILSTVYE